MIKAGICFLGKCDSTPVEFVGRISYMALVKSCEANLHG